MDGRTGTKFVGLSLRRLFYCFLFSVGPLLSPIGGEAFAQCSSLVNGAIVIDVEGCKQITPETQFDTKRPDLKFISDLDSIARAKFFQSYRGAVVKAKVVQSRARRVGLSDDKTALANETVYVFLPPGGPGCAEANGKRLGGEVVEICCAGSGNAPCLTGTSYVFNTSSVVGNAGTAAGDAQRTKASQSKGVLEGDKFMRSKKYRDAIKAYSAAYSGGDLDTKGKYNLGYAYRQVDECHNAIKPLKEIYELNLKGKTWGDEEPIVRRSNFLLARCYSKSKDPQGAVLILNGYLLEPSKFKQELRDSMRHKDFGWIHTSREYKDYRAEAQKRLKGVR